MTSPDYATLIDAPTWAFIRATDAHYPPDAINRTIGEQRAVYDRMCRAFHRGYPAGVTAEDRPIAGIPCRVFAGSDPTVLYLHGGGFVVGGLESHDDICAEIRARTGLSVVCADYRLAPEHRHPAAFEDCMAVARSLAAAGPILLCGDSAGGNLCAAVSHALRGSGAVILGQVLAYPGLGGAPEKGSYITHAHAPMLTRDDVLFYKDIRHGTAPPVGDATVNPLQDSSFANLPPTLAISAQCDPLADDARDYAARITAAGGHAVWVEEKGLVHAYLRARSTVPRAAASFTRIVETLSAMARSHWPKGDCA